MEWRETRMLQAVILGVILDVLIGDPHGIPHPICWIGNLISYLTKKWNKGSKTARRFKGALMVLVVVIVPTAITVGVLALSYHVNFYLGIGVEAILCCYMLAATSLKKESKKVYTDLEAENLEQARYDLSMIVGRDTKDLSEEGVIKAAVETVAENTSDGIIAPLFYMLFFGASAGVFYKSINTMDSMVGYKNETYMDYGRVAARLDDVANYIPSRIAAISMILASPLLGFSGKNAFYIWKRDKRKHESPNSAQTESVCAGALGIKLAGPAYYFGEYHKKEYIGDELRKIERKDILRSHRLMYATEGIVLLVGIAIRLGICFGIRGMF